FFLWKIPDFFSEIPDFFGVPEFGVPPDPFSPRFPPARVPEGGPRRVLDAPARQRRLHRQLEALENDNFGDDPQAGLPRPGKRLPNFSDTAETGKKKKKTRGGSFQAALPQNFQALLEEQNLSAAEGPNYVSAGAAPSRLPQRHFCAVCGFPSGYTCVTCGARYCCTRCLGTTRTPGA
ncbi:zinc finger HIT domain-containing protein 1, partial [Molothrus ater]|uniref:zinc finger HIT domain-containing protein 1 n=1 Tax=Molothrus ater TaxID=84834 RepID=UPI0023E7F3A2